jgi:hypothetical protein
MAESDVPPRKLLTQELATGTQKLPADLAPPMIAAPVVEVHTDAVAQVILLI